MRVQHQIPQEHEQAHQHHDDAERLRHTDGLAEQLPIEKIQAVGAQTLHPEATNAVPEEVKPGIFAVELPMLGHDEQKQ